MRKESPFWFGRRSRELREHPNYVVCSECRAWSDWPSTNCFRWMLGSRKGREWSSPFPGVETPRYAKRSPSGPEHIGKHFRYIEAFPGLVSERRRLVSLLTS